jgi:phosphatidylserine decarboxylase
VNYDEFVGVDRSDVHYGFPSWHAWFTREIKEEARPFNPNAHNEIINNSEYYPNFNMPYNNVEWHDKFWLKDQRYSLAEMFGVDALPAAQQAYFRNEFEGGTVFQGFLNPWCYHRWRAPVGGKLEKAYSVGNSYYAGNPSLSFHLAESYIASQPLLTMTSVRQIYVIETGLANIGKVAIIEIGMAEVSGIKSVVTEGQTVKKGDLLGWFRFGGSSHAIIFSNKARNLKFSDAIYERKFNPVTGVHDSVRQRVRSVLATVS